MQNFYKVFFSFCFSNYKRKLMQKVTGRSERKKTQAQERSYRGKGELGAWETGKGNTWGRRGGGAGEGTGKPSG